MAQAQEVIQHQESPPPAMQPQGESGALISMIERAARDPSVDVDKMLRLFDMHKQVTADRARQAFNAAVALAKGEIGPITKNAKGHNEKRYADFSAYAKVVDPVLAKHGIGYRFRTEQTDRINVTCVLFHNAGHSEENTLSGPPDSSGSKNAIQSIGSTLTYLQRYSLIQSLGLSATNDDDGRASGSQQDTGAISEKQVQHLQSLIVEVGADIPLFLRYMKVDRLEDIEAQYFDAAVKALEAKRGKGAKK
jgi:hypothetical protein